MAKKKTTAQEIVISPPNFGWITFTIEGTDPLVMHKFGEKGRRMMQEQQEAGSSAKNKRKRPPKDFTKLYEDAKHVSTGGWLGIPATSFRNASISACRVAGYTMTRAKLSVFCVADGFSDDGTPLVKITKGKPKMHISPVRLATGVIDLSSRPMWAPGWQAKPTIRFDRDQFQPQDIANLLHRVGQQVGIMEGRPDSKDSAGCGWGLFNLVETKEKEKTA